MRSNSARKSLPAAIAALSGRRGESPLAIKSAFTKCMTPTSLGRNSLAKVVLPAPFGPAMTMQRGRSKWVLPGFIPDALSSSCRSADALHDPHVALDRVLAQGLQRLLVARAVVRGERLLQAFELDHHHALVESLLVHLCGAAPHQIAAARGLDRRRRKLRVSRECIGIFHGVITDNPIGFGHRSFLSLVGLDSSRLAASPSTSSVRSSARRVRASASSFFRVKPSMSPRVSRAASSMSHRNASSRSSGFIEDFDVGLDRFPAVRILENLLARYIDLPVAEQGGKIILHLRNVPQRYLAPRLELDHEIDVARRAHIASRGGAEPAQFPDAVLSAQRCDFFSRDEQAAGRRACGVARLRLAHRQGRERRTPRHGSARQLCRKALAPEYLCNDAAQFPEDGRVAIGPVMLLVAEAGDPHPPPAGEGLRLPRHPPHPPVPRAP